MNGTKRITGLRVDRCFYLLALVTLFASAYFHAWLMILASISAALLGYYLKLTNQERLIFRHVDKTRKP